jgi:hypothetical protein
MLCLCVECSFISFPLETKHSKRYVPIVAAGDLRNLLNDNTFLEGHVPDAFVFDPPWGIIPGKLGKIIPEDEVIPAPSVPQNVTNVLLRMGDKRDGVIAVRLDMGPMQAAIWWGAMKERGMHCHVVRIQDTVQRANSRAAANLKRTRMTQVGWQWIIGMKSYRAQYTPKGTLVRSIVVLCLDVFFFFMKLTVSERCVD